MTLAVEVYQRGEPEYVEYQRALRLTIPDLEQFLEQAEEQRWQRLTHAISQGTGQGSEQQHIP